MQDFQELRDRLGRKNICVRHLYQMIAISRGGVCVQEPGQAGTRSCLCPNWFLEVQPADADESPNYSFCIYYCHYQY